MNFSGISQRTPMGWLLRVPLHLIPPGTVLPILQGRLRGSKWVVGSSNHGCWLGSYEFDKQHLISELVAPGTVAFDIGANVGFYTLLLSKLVGPAGKVVAFEPFPDNVAYLERHIRLNQLANVDVLDVAVADAPGKTFFKTGATNSMGFITQEAGVGELEVAQVALDDLIARGKVPVPDYVKIDIEGAELLALQGAQQTLRQHHPIIFLATHGADVHRACCALLSDLGYTLEPVRGQDVATTDEIIARFA